VGGIIADMTARVDARRHATRPRGVTGAEVLEWADHAGFSGTIHELSRRWQATPADALVAITRRSWPAMRELDELTIQEVTRPAIEALERLAPTDSLRRATADMIVLRR
jgi:hypothetical protein